MTAKKQPSFQELQAELDAILVRLSDDSTDIDKALTDYHRGTAVLAQLEAQLDTAKNNVTKVVAPKAAKKNL